MILIPKKYGLISYHGPYAARQFAVIVAAICALCGLTAEAARVPEVPADTTDSVAGYDLDGITVSASLRDRDAVKETIKITNAMREGTNSTLSLLAKVKGVRVDPSSESVKMDMQSDVPLLVDEKEVDREYAKSLNPQRIDKVEILRNPKGRFSSYPVVINIILKKSYIGTDLGLNANAKTSLRNPASNGESANARVTFSSGRWNVYANASYRHRLAYDATRHEETVFGTKEEYGTTDVSNPDRKEKGDMGNLFIGCDWSVADGHSLTLQGSGGIAKASLFEDYAENATSPFRINDSSWTQEYAAGLFYSGRLSPKVRLSAEAFYNFYQEKDSYLYTLLSPLSTSPDDNNGRKHLARGNVRGSWSASDRISLALDHTFTFREYSVFGMPEKTLDFRSTEYRNLTDLSLSWNIPEKLYVSAGASLLDIDNSYREDVRKLSDNNFAVHPYGRLYWIIVRDLNLSLGYYHSTDYPNLSMLSPVRQQTGGRTYREGNPSLGYSGEDRIEAEISYKGIVKLSFMQRFDDGAISPFYYTEGGKVIQTYAQSRYTHGYIGLNGTVTKGEAFTWNILGSYQWYSRKLMEGGSRHGRTWYFDTDATYAFSQAATSVTAGYFLRHDKFPLLQGREYNQQEVLFLSVRKGLFKNRLSLSLTGSIPVSLISKTRWTKVEIPDFKSATFTNDKVNNSMVMFSVYALIGNSRSRSADNALRLEKEQQEKINF